MSSRKKCQFCDKPSIPGLKHGIGLCQFHYNSQGWGPRWAVACLVSEIVTDASKYGISEEDLIHEIKHMFKVKKTADKAKGKEINPVKP